MNKIRERASSDPQNRRICIWSGSGRAHYRKKSTGTRQPRAEENQIVNHAGEF